MTVISHPTGREVVARTPRTRLLLTLTLVGLGLAGCRETHIRSYTVPSERGRRAATLAPPSQGGNPGAMSGVPAGGPARPEWHLPEGWQEIPGSGMRFATIVVEPGDKPLEIRVTPLALAARNPLDNVNRWRGQIGLDPISQAEIGSVMKSFTVDGCPVELVNMTGVSADGTPPNQILAAMLTTDSQVWFFLMLDDAKRVAQYPAAFESLIRGIHLTGAPAGAPGPAAAGSSAPGVAAPPLGRPPDAASGESMTWTAPSEWARDPKASDMRVASFKLPGDAGEVAITKFPGDVGGLLANINRWRKQLEMPPVAGPEEQPSESITVAGQPARLFDIAQPGAAGTRQRMLVVLLARPDMTWFIKMTGSAAALDGQASAFRAFVRTIQLQGGVR